MYFSSVVLAFIGNPPGVATEIYVNHAYKYQVKISDFNLKSSLLGEMLYNSGTTFDLFRFQTSGFNIKMKAAP